MPASLTPLFKCEGALSLANPTRLTAYLPGYLVPLRRYCRLEVSGSSIQGTVTVRVTHEEPFGCPVPGRNAWQRVGLYPEVSQRAVTRLDRRWDLVEGDVHAVRRLKRLVYGPPSVDCLVRVTEDGFDLVVPVDEGGRFNVRTWPTALNVGDLQELVATHPAHGGLRAPKENEDMPNYKKPACADRTPEQLVAELPFGLLGDAKVIACEFEDASGRDYAYLAEGDLEVVEGDYVTVVSPYGPGVFDERAGGYLRVVRVTSLEPGADGVKKAHRWVVGRVDLSAYVARVARVRELQELDARIERAEREARKMLELEKLRALSPDLDALVKRRLELTGTRSEAVEELPGDGMFEPEPGHTP